MASTVRKEKKEEKKVNWYTNVDDFFCMSREAYRAKYPGRLRALDGEILEEEKIIKENRNKRAASASK